jgi:hypothetical protein
MTPAQRQARRRETVRQRAKAALQLERELNNPLGRERLQPAYGYGKAKAKLIEEHHKFERARREFGFEEGIFLDGACVDSVEVVRLAALSPTERAGRIEVQRRATKDFAIMAVEGYMRHLHVTLDDLIHASTPQARRARSGPRVGDL